MFVAAHYKEQAMFTSNQKEQSSSCQRARSSTAVRLRLDIDKGTLMNTNEVF